jgi:pimeloyl-ACP methyl ester carboxylesterase
MEKLLIETAPGVLSQTYWHDGGDKLIVWHHGTPAPRPMSPQMLEVFSKHGYSVAAPVRQGYMQSTAVGPRPIRDDAQVSKAVVNHLGFKEFRTIGYSGGGPRALADLALLENCLAGIAFAPMVPTNLPDFNPFEKTPAEELAVFEEVKRWEPNLEERFLAWQKEYSAEDPLSAYKDADEETRAWLESPDAQFRFKQRDLAFETGVTGWMLDEYSMLVDYGFDVSEISKPLQIITGDQDVNVDMSCSVWLNEKIDGSELKVYQGYGHSRIFNIDVIDEALKAF